ncbi:MAG TPA: sulfotransferase [Rhizomicrobium sp.]|nr:sulfotransferase [Rhizomicrobium sp.]
MSEDFKSAYLLHEQNRLDEAEPHYRAVGEDDPDYFNALNNLGLLLMRTNRLDEAIAVTRKASSLEPRNAETLNNLANMLAASGAHDEAWETFKASLAIYPANPRTLLRFLREARVLDRSQEAFPYMEAAARQKPRDAEFQQMLGALLNGLGRTEEARQAFERAVALRPNGHYYRDLAIVIRFTQDNPHLASMEQMARAPEAMPPDEWMALNFALGKAYADIGEHQRSFRHQIEGNRIRRAHTQYDEAGTLDLITRIQAAFDRDTVRDGGKGDPSERPVFIVGMPRSGSTLVEQVLASHPKFAGIGESPAFENSLRAIFGDMSFPEMAFALPEQLRATGEVYCAATMHPEAQRVADKMLANFLHAGLIHMVLPRARIIHVMRDPVDTCLSIFAEEFPAGAPWLFDLGELGRYYRAYARLMAHWRDVLPDGVMIDIRYEDVVACLEKEARRMIAHVGLEWDPACLSFDKTERAVWTASAAQVRRPIYKSSVGRWRPDPATLAPLLDALGDLAT